tara:strand:+ start:2235 stop:2960 length:726 start_codon:yes stop_codon:yes gene_type:complete
MKNFFKKILILLAQSIKFVKNHVSSNFKTPYDRFTEDEINDCYLTFKKHFYSSIFFETPSEIRDYSIKKSLESYEDENLYLEFGFGVGKSLRLFSNILKDKKIYSFDAGGGNLLEDWVGYIGHPSYKIRGTRSEKPKDTRKNEELIWGWVQDTLEPFLKQHENKKINFVHMDLDTYESSLFVLKKIKPHLKKNSIILFDELYNYSGWKVGEYKALIETFNENEYKYLSFCSKYSQVAIQIL